MVSVFIGLTLLHRWPRCASESVVNSDCRALVRRAPSHRGTSHHLPAGRPGTTLVYRFCTFFDCCVHTALAVPSVARTQQSGVAYRDRAWRHTDPSPWMSSAFADHRQPTRLADATLHLFDCSAVATTGRHPELSAGGCFAEEARRPPTTWAIVGAAACHSRGVATRGGPTSNEGPHQPGEAPLVAMSRTPSRERVADVRDYCAAPVPIAGAGAGALVLPLVHPDVLEDAHGPGHRCPADREGDDVAPWCE